MNINRTDENKSTLNNYRTDILTFGIIAKIYCPKHIGIQLSQIIAKFGLDKKSFPAISKNVSNLISDYSFVYQVWLSILNRNSISPKNLSKYQTIRKIVELFQLYEPQKSLFNYLFIVINDFQQNKSKSQLLHDILDLHSRFTSQLPASNLLELTIDLLKILPTRYDPSKMQNDSPPVIEEDVYSKEFPPFWCLPHESAQYNHLLGQDKESDYEGENLDTAPKIDQSYVRSTEIVPCKGFPLYLTNNVAKSYSVGSEGDHYTVERRSHQMYSNALQIMFNKFENLVIQDDHVDLVLSLGDIPGARQRILLHDLYGEAWSRFDRLFKEHRKENLIYQLQPLKQRLQSQKKLTTSKSRTKILDFYLSNLEPNQQSDQNIPNTSATIESRCKNSVGRVLRSQYYAARELESYLRSMPDFDLSEFQTFSMNKTPINFQYESSLSACVLLEEILKLLPNMPWFFDKVIPRTRLVSLDSLSSISMICGNSLANALYHYAQCIQLLFEFLPLEKPKNQEFVRLNYEYIPVNRGKSATERAKTYMSFEDEIDDDDGFVLEDPYDQLYQNELKDQSGDERSIFDNFYSDQPDVIHIDTIVPSVIEDEQSQKKSTPIINDKEDRYVAAIENSVFFIYQKYDLPIKSSHINFAQRFVSEFDIYIENLDKWIEEAMDRFGSKTKYFIDFCYIAQRLSAMASAMRATNEWKNTKKLLLKFGTISSSNSDVLKESFPQYLFQARNKLPFTLSKLDFSVGNNTINITPLG